jgi:hypothetical protein
VTAKGKSSIPRDPTIPIRYVFLHECAHAYLHHNDGRRKPRYMEELEAFEWARDRMAQHGIPVPLLEIENAQINVAYFTEQRKRRERVKNIDPRAIEFAGPEAMKQIRDRIRQKRRDAADR